MHAKRSLLKKQFNCKDLKKKIAVGISYNIFPTSTGPGGGRVSSQGFYLQLEGGGRAVERTPGQEGPCGREVEAARYHPDVIW